MSSENSGMPKMILPYDWILKNVGEERRTIASKMILFRGERVFRVGLKNHGESPVLFLMAVNLSQIGMKVESVMYGRQENDIGADERRWEMKNENIGNEGSLQLFTMKLDDKITGDCTFVFRICVEGSVPGYSYQLSDRLAKDQLLAAAAVKSQNSVDVEFLVKKTKLFAHKAILAARSPVFATEFAEGKPNEEEEEPKMKRIKRKAIEEPLDQLVLFRPIPEEVSNAIMAPGKVAAGLYRIRMEDVNPSTVEQFLHFIYTGEFTSTLANEELLKLAEYYQLTTLISLCQTALKKSDDALQMVSIVKSLHIKSDDATPSSTQISPKNNTEILFDRTASTFRCVWRFPMFESVQPNAMANYQNETLFFAYVISPTMGREASIHFSCANLKNAGVKVEEVYMNQRSHTSEWVKMKSTRQPDNAVLLFSAPSPVDLFHHECRNVVAFDARIVGTIDSYYYEIMDDAWMKDIWTAAINKQLTDVEIFVGAGKLMEAHRVVLVARSPVLNASLGMTSGTGKHIVAIDEEFDVDVVVLFLKFLYTGALVRLASARDKLQLLTLAKTYEVETLKNVCQFADRPPEDVEDLTNSLLEFV